MEMGATILCTLASRNVASVTHEQADVNQNATDYLVKTPIEIVREYILSELDSQTLSKFLVLSRKSYTAVKGSCQSYQKIIKEYIFKRLTTAKSNHLDSVCRDEALHNWRAIVRHRQLSPSDIIWSLLKIAKAEKDPQQANLILGGVLERAQSQMANSKSPMLFKVMKRMKSLKEMLEVSVLIPCPEFRVKALLKIAKIDVKGADVYLRQALEHSTVMVNGRHKIKTCLQVIKVIKEVIQDSAQSDEILSEALQLTQHIAVDRDKIEVLSQIAEAIEDPELSGTILGEALKLTLSNNDSSITCSITNLGDALVRMIRATRDLKKAKEVAQYIAVWNEKDQIRANIEIAKKSPEGAEDLLKETLEKINNTVFKEFKSEWFLEMAKIVKDPEQAVAILSQAVEATSFIENNRIKAKTLLEIVKAIRNPEQAYTVLYQALQTAIQIRFETDGKHGRSRDHTILKIITTPIEMNFDQLQGLIDLIPQKDCYMKVKVCLKLAKSRENSEEINELVRQALMCAVKADNSQLLSQIALAI